MAASKVGAVPMMPESELMTEEAIVRHIAHGESLDARGDVDVVRDEEGLAGVKTQDEALVPGALVVVREDPDDDALALDLEVRRVGVEGPRERSVAAGHTVD